MEPVLGPAKPVPWEDADDCDALRADPLFKPASGKAPESGGALCSQPAMSRLEIAPSRIEVARMTAALVDLLRLALLPCYGRSSSLHNLNMVQFDEENKIKILQSVRYQDRTAKLAGGMTQHYSRDRNAHSYYMLSLQMSAPASP